MSRPYFSGDIGCYGMHLTIDAKNCNYSVREIVMVRSFLSSLVDKIGMVAHGQPIVERFGGERADQMGISGVQLITTSSITIHTNDEYLDAFLDVFSCKSFDRDLVSKHFLERFNPEKMIMKVHGRGVKGELF